MTETAEFIDTSDEFWEMVATTSVFEVSEIAPMRPGEGHATAVKVRRCLVVANRTLVSPGLRELMEERASIGLFEFHILVPRQHQTTLFVGDPLTGVFDAEVFAATQRDNERADLDAQRWLEEFMSTLADLDGSVTGEVNVGIDTVDAIRHVMNRSRFDEIIVSTVPSKILSWFKLDLPSRIRRAFALPVTALDQQPA